MRIRPSVFKRRYTRPTETIPHQHQMILPMSIRCKGCSNCIPKGSKFTCREELLHDLRYYGFRINRLFFNCPSCNHEVIMKNSTRNNRYVVEGGATCTGDVDALLREIEGLVLGPSKIEK